MHVKYFRNIIESLLKQGLSQAYIAKELKFKPQNITEILGKSQTVAVRQNLKDEQLAHLIRLCRRYKIEPNTWSKLGKLIDKEMK